MKKITIGLALCAILFTARVNAESILRMSTTTSTENSGLLQVLNPVFEKKYGARLDVIAVGTGKALKLGENGDVDVVFVHAPKAEEAFVNAGFGVDRKAVMHNDFVLVGAKADIAAVKASGSAAEAFLKISRAAAPFISRGDDSGTHKKERELWRTAGVEPKGSWYVSAGQGMGAVLKMADEKQAYALADRGTFIAYQDKTDLVIVFEGGENLLNPYHVIAVNPARFPHVNYDLARQYIDFITGEEGQAIIRSFKKDGQALFTPDAVQ